MRTVTILHNQSLFDVCIQVYGNLEPVFALALANNLSVTDFIVAGTELAVPESANQNTDILNYYASKGVLPATALTETDLSAIKNTDDCDLCKLFL